MSPRPKKRKARAGPKLLECSAMGCTARIPMTLLMCREHWFRVPEPLRDAIYHTYHTGPSWAYRNNVTEAIRVVASAPLNQERVG